MPTESVLHMHRATPLAGRVTSAIAQEEERRRRRRTIARHKSDRPGTPGVVIALDGEHSWVSATWRDRYATVPIAAPTAWP
jgi:hypothetical protein